MNTKTSIRQVKRAQPGDCFVLLNPLGEEVYLCVDPQFGSRAIGGIPTAEIIYGVSLKTGRPIQVDNADVSSLVVIPTQDPIEFK